MRVKSDDLLKLAFVAPMADIGFLLIIFFIVTSDLERDAADEQILLPSITNGKPIRLKKAEQLTINIRKTGEITVSGAVVTPETLNSLLDTVSQQWGSAHAVVIRGDRDTEFSETGKVIKMLNKSGFSNISFCVEITGKP